MATGSLAGKVAIVTGASAGIGRAYTLALADAGATVVAAARSLGRSGDEPPAHNTLAEVVHVATPLPGRVFAQACDVEREDDIARLVDSTVTNFGRLDILVNNAGLMTTFRPFEIGTDDWDLVMRVNVRAP